MNIFYLDEDPKICAAYHCDKHVLKMVIESAQLLSNAHWYYCHNGAVCFNPIFMNHPCSIWVRSSHENYGWLVELDRYLLEEYTKRYGKIHAIATKWEKLKIAPLGISRAQFTPPPQAMPFQYKRFNTVLAYREYYIGDKIRFAKWKNSPMPEWFVRALVAHPVKPLLSLKIKHAAI